jgi:omega-amidase
VHFPLYAEKIGYVPGQGYNVMTSESESAKMLSSVAKEAGVWLIGGLKFHLASGKIANKF